MSPKSFERDFPLLSRILPSLTHRPVIILEDTGKILLFNSGAEELTNYRAADIEGGHVERILLDKSGDLAINQFFLKPSNEESRINTTVKTNKNGSKNIAWRVINSSSRNGENEIAICIGSSTPAKGNTLKQVNNEYREAKETVEKYRTLFEFAYDAILFSRFETGRIFEVNPEAESLLGYTTEELLDKKLPDILSNGNLKNLKSQLEQNRFFYRESQSLSKNDGSEIITSMSASLIEYQGDKTILSLFHDMTRRIELEEKLRERAESLKDSNEKLEELIQIISHDLKEPLRSIGSYSDMLKAQNSEELTEGTRNKLERLKRNASRLKEMLDDVSNLSKLMMNDSPSLVDMEDIVEEIKGEIAINSGRAEITVQNDFPKVKFDRFQLKVLIKNLISNALKYNSPPKHAKIGYKDNRNEERLTCFVRDNGRGIAEEYRDTIFKMFEQLEPDRNEMGMGAGLAFCKRIVNGHEGKIWLDSEVGEGSTFYFTLPAP